MARLIENYIPVVKWDGLNTNKNVTVGGGATVDFTAAGSVKLPASVVISASQDFTPAADATNAFEFTNAADSAIVLDIDTTNQRIGIGNGAATPGYSLDVQGSSAANSRVAVTSDNAGALSVGLTIANPAFNVDSSTASQVAGLSVKGAVTGGVVSATVTDSGSNASLTVDGKGTGTLGLNTVSTTSGLVTIGNATSVAGALVNGPMTVTSAGALALAVGRLGATTSAFSVDASTGTQVAGLNVKGAATGGTVAVVATDSGSNTSLTVDGKGSGTVGVNTVSTTAGIVTLGNSTSKLGLVINGPNQVNNKPTAFNSTGTVTAAALAGGYITSTSGAATTMTLPTGTAMGSQLGATQGTIFDFTIDNTAGSNTFTVAVAVNGILSAAAVANAGSQGLLTVPTGVTGQGQFRMMFSSA